MTHCRAPLTVDREGGDCADPTCTAHQHNEDGPEPHRPRMPCGCDASATHHTCDTEAQYVEEALAAVDSGSAGHWPTVAGYLADEVRRLRTLECTITCDQPCCQMRGHCPLDPTSSPGY